MIYWEQEIETMPVPELRVLQGQRLKSTLQRALTSPYYQQMYKEIKEAPTFMCISMIVLAIFSIGLGVLLLPQLREIVLQPAVDAVAGGLSYAKMVLGG